jgi:HK97 family phage portal protein
VSILTRLLGRSPLSRSGPWPLSETPGRVFAVNESSSGAAVDEDSALSVSAVFSGVMLLSRVLSMLPLTVYRRVRKYGRDAEVEATTNPAYWLLLHEMNPEMSAVIARRVMDTHRLLWGNCYGKIAWYGSGKVAAVWPVEPWRVRPRRDDAGTLYYELDGQTRVDAPDMVHVPLVSFDGVTGRSWIDYAFESLGMSISAQEFAGRFFANDATPGVVLRHPGNPKKETREELKKTWNESHAGPRNTRKTGVIWGGWEVAAGEMVSPGDAQLLESRRFGVEEVARWLSIPPHLLRDLSRATFSNIEQQGLDFLIYSIGPTLAEYEAEYNRKLLNPPDVICRHNTKALLKNDRVTRTQVYHNLLADGVYSINDVLEEEGLPPVEGGNTHFVPLNMVPLIRAAAPPAAPPAPPAPEPAPAPEPPAPPDASDLLAVCAKLAGKEYPAAAVEDILRASYPALDTALIANLVGAIASYRPPVAPEPAGPADPAAPPAAGPAPSPALSVLVASTLDRLLRVEANALTRALARPAGLLAWMDDFYPKHEQRLAEALAPVMGIAGGDAGSVAREWCGRSRANLLDAAEVRPAELAGSVGRMLASWTERPAQVAGEVCRAQGE